MTTYFATVQSPGAYNNKRSALRSNNAGLTLDSLLAKGLSGSKWNTEHLILFRVLIDGGGSPFNLPALAQGQHYPQRIDNFINAKRQDMETMHEDRLSKLDPLLGIGFAALGRILCSRPGDNHGPAETRSSASAPVPNLYRAPSYSSELGSATESSGGESSVDAYIPLDNTSPELLPPEAITVEAVSSFFRHCFLRNGKTNRAATLQWDPRPNTLRTNIGRRYFTAINDGGIIRQVSGARDESTWSQFRIALLEAKKNGAVSDERGHVHISDKWLAQMVAEVLAVRLGSGTSTRARQDKEVIVIAASGTLVKFLKFLVSDNYLDQLKLSLGPANANNSDPPGFTDFMRIKQTPWYNLSETQDRKTFYRVTEALWNTYV